MKTPPEAYLIFREELQKQKEENRRLKEEYAGRLSGLSEELKILREQISSQQGMLQTTVEYAMRLEDELDSLKGKVSKTSNNNRSYH